MNETKIPCRISSLNFKLKIKTCEMHTCGEPVRIIESVSPPIIFPKNSNILDKRRYLTHELDHIRRVAILEPRGHKDMFGIMLTEPNPSNDSDYGLLFLNNEGYGTMCGHATIAIARYLIEKNMFKPTIPETEIKFDCPCGLVIVKIEYNGFSIGNTRFFSVPAFVERLDYEIFVDKLNKTVKCDIIFGGNYYAVVSDKDLSVDMTINSPMEVVNAATFLQREIERSFGLLHPTNKDINYLYGVIVTNGEDHLPTTKTFCVFGINAYDRSPCGSGSTAVVAAQYFRGNMRINDVKRTENAYLGQYSHFISRPIEETVLYRENGSAVKGIIVEISGKSNFIGESIFLVEDDDSYKIGF